MGLKAELENVRARAGELLRAGKDRDLTDTELQEVDDLHHRHDALSKAIEREEKSQANLRAIQGMTPLDMDDLAHSGGIPGTPASPATKARWTPLKAAPLWRRAIEARVGRGTGVKEADWTAGAVGVPTLFSAGVVPLDRPPTSVLDLLTYRQLDSTSRFTYYVQTARDLAAAVVPAGGLKPESDPGFGEKEGQAQKIAVYARPVPREFLADLEGLDRFIGDELVYDVEFRLQQEVLTGTGEPDHLDGILPQVTTTVTGGDFLNLAGGALADLTDLGVAPNALLMNTQDSMAVDQVKDWGGAYLGAGPFQTGPNTLWGIPRIATPAMPRGTALLGDFRAAQLVMREQATVSWSDSHADTFIHNLVTYLAELRAGLALVRPWAFVAIDAEQIGTPPPDGGEPLRSSLGSGSGSQPTKAQASSARSKP